MLAKRHASTSLIALASLFWLAGAKADGCTGSVTPEEPTLPAGGECAPGTHLESFCDPAVLGGGAADPGMPGVAGAPFGNCHDECVPDGGLCPPGFGEQWVCEAWAEGGVPGAPPAPPDCDPNYGACPPPPPPPCDPANGDCPPPPPPPCDPANGDCPPPPSCYLECVPLDPCGPGFHAEYQCGGGEPVPMGEPGQPPPPPPAGTAGSDPGQPPPVPPEDCGFVCVPDSICPDGMYETTVCTGVAEPGDPGLPPQPGDPSLPPDPGVCYTQCMPLC
ncbi:MAG: hypothetical protein IT373_34410, partial [Polyangiaceae bacterium]|nr:hypothetical protein [Polyangiaceae bacterium]